MLKAKKRITKREMQEDPLITSYENVTFFYEENKKMISYVVTGVVLLILAGWFFFNNRMRKNDEAATTLGRVYSYYDAGANDLTSFQKAIDGLPEKNVKGLKDIVANYDGTDAGELAQYYLANAYFNLGKIDEALKNFEDCSSSDPLVKASVLAGIGGCYESKKNYAEAASYFEKAASAQTIEAPQYLEDAGKCYGLKGDKEKALSFYNRLKKEYPTSTQAREVDRYIAEYAS